LSFRLCDSEGLIILGIYARAGNDNLEKIGDLWRRFHAMGGPAAIPARRDDAVYCVYCEYETDFTGAFTVLIGCAVDADAEIPDGMKKLAIEAGEFAVFEPMGELPMSVLETWAEIWNAPLDRRYQADFDRYGSDGKVTVQVGVR
jgi:predicted transcriptional regulator YdeE